LVKAAVSDVVATVKLATGAVTTGVALTVKARLPEVLDVKSAASVGVKTACGSDGEHRARPSSDDFAQTAQKMGQTRRSVPFL
jgi:hypothetical protein